jgi:pseudouridine-5'-phosphate glycosidase
MAIPLHRSDEVASAQAEGRAVVALESTLIAHGLPTPLNVETALEAEKAVRAAGATPATIAVIDGSIRVGLTLAEIERLAHDQSVLKASRRDLGIALALKRTAATTVAATMALACRAGIRVFATGGIGGVHRGGHASLDISADLLELARTPVCVVCAGAKSILDIPLTLEVLETHGVPVLGYRTGDFPGFYLVSSGAGVQVRIDSPSEAAAIALNHWRLGGAGLLLAQPPPAHLALSPEELEQALVQAEQAAEQAGIRGQELTPYLLARLAELTAGRTVVVNQALIVANAGLAGRVACELAGKLPDGEPHSDR